MLETSKLYETIQNMDASENTKKGIVGLIEFQTNSGIQKVLDKMDAMETRLESRIDAVETKMDAMETKMNSKIDITASKIKTTNILATGIVIAIVAGIVMSFFNRQ